MREPGGDATKPGADVNRPGGNLAGHGSEGTVRLGFVGVGTIAEAMIEALLTGTGRHETRSAPGDLRITLSPRSAERSARLAQRHPEVTVAADNQAVVESSDVVVLGVLPDQLAEVCSALTFRADQTVVGLAAGWPPSRLAPRVAPATEVCQLIPLPMIALHAGPLVLYPNIPAIAELFAGCGRIVTPAAEDDIPLFSAASASMSTFFAFQTTVIEWLVSQGVDGPTAKDYVASLFSGLSGETMATAYDDVPGLVAEHETPGGLNAQLRGSLQQDGVFAGMTSYLTALVDRLRG